MPVIRQKIAIGISGCCMGAKVRYNGKGWDMLKFIGREKGDYLWHPVCPECLAGLPVPRNPIRIHPDGRQVWEGGGRVLSRSGDLTRDLKEGCRISLEVLRKAGVGVFVFMEGSPSCGIHRTTLKGNRRGNPPGVFGHLLEEEGFFTIPVAVLQSPILWWDARRRMLAFLWLSEQEAATPRELYGIWHVLKFLCQELDNPLAREWGKRLSAMKPGDFPGLGEAFKREVLALLRTPSTLPRIKQSMWKNYIHYRRKTGKDLAQIKMPTDLRSATALAGELLLLERESAVGEVLFGTSPIVYRP
ncbi:DUF523 domain-containing protein [Clostridiales bacterium F-3ap]|uniref:DUF523 domain-containing protein n=2 Tax=Anaerotalea alkaliphila TaxID=2662126 RepID=A0A7X5KPA7_9FIRM|nr:DUF523 domain-containing protein [Anaerotalea alkaliphila]